MDTSDLAEAASDWRSAATASEDAFEQHRQNISAPGGTTWEGDAKDAALDRVTTDLAVVRRHVACLREAAAIAEAGVTDITTAQREALDAITAAENHGSHVAEGHKVTDTRRYDISTIVERNRAVAEHAEEIRWYAERLAQAIAFVDERLQAKAAELEGIRFDGEGDAGDATVQFVSNELKLNPQDGEDPDGGYKPHPEYPDHKPNGEWGPGNSGLEGHAEAQKAFDARMRDTDIPIERKLIRVYLTDPKTGKTLRREYDGLEEIPGQPGKYVGLEHKLGYKDPTKHQQDFDDLVRSGIPARGTLNGQAIEVADAELIRTPRPGDATTGAAGGEAAAGPVPKSAVDGSADGFGGVQAEGTVPLTPAPANGPNFPGWGTQLTPQQMIDSDDPALRVAGQEIRRRMAEQGIVDPSGLA